MLKVTQLSDFGGTRIQDCQPPKPMSSSTSRHSLVQTSSTSLVLVLLLGPCAMPPAASLLLLSYGTLHYLI